MTGRGARLLAVAVAALALVLATAAPAAAHPGDPTLVTRLHSVSPALPDGVTVALRTTLADQLVVSNPTATPLVALDPDGTEFLRVSADGVQGNPASPYFHLSAAPPGVRVAVPPPGGPPSWVPLSAGSTWAWYDPRLSPSYLEVPVGGRQDVPAAEVLATWRVRLRYGDTPVSVDGALERRPVTGRFETTLDRVPPGMSAVLAQGYVPSLSVRADAGRAVTVLGRDGRPYLRFTPEGAQVDQGSPTHRDDQLGRGRPVSDADVGWVTLPGPSGTWLDVRLRFPAEDPPAELADAVAPVEVSRWEVPVVVDGVRQALAGSIRWLPAPASPVGAGSGWAVVGLVAGAVLLSGAGAVLVVRSRRLAGRAVGEDRERAHQPTP